jgi:kynurenine formamidase
MSSRRVVDLSHPLDERIPMFPGLPAPQVLEHLSREDSRSHYAGETTFVLHRYVFAGNSGTYLDAPFHRYAEGDDLAALALERAVDLPGMVVDLREPVAKGTRGFGTEALPDRDLSGHAVLFLTGWSARWGGADYLDPNPFITGDVAARLVEQGVALVGIDSWNIDDTHDGTRPAHSNLLRAGVPIVENLCRLEQLPSSGFRFFAAPQPIRGGSAVPVRAYAVV